MIRGWAAASVLALAAGAAQAADQPLYGPPAAWVRVADTPKLAPAAEGAPALQAIVMDRQLRFADDGDDTYAETVIRLNSPQALTALGSVTRDWNPDTDTLTFHRLRILRGDQVIDLLAQGKRPTVLRRETHLEAAALDGTLTATLQLEDLRLGDAVDVAATIHHRDPVLQGRSEGYGSLPDLGVINHYRFRVLWPKAKPIRWRATPGFDPPRQVVTANDIELVSDLTDVRAPKAPRAAPLRFQHVGELQLTQFKDWSEVSGLLKPVYDKAETLDANSPLKAEIARIAAANRTPEAKAFAALKLVQDQTRYVYLGMNFGGYIPAAADLTWSRKFGDCKGKTVLLLALLHGLGIEAEAAMVSTVDGDGMDERLPTLGGFDHVLVRATIGGAVYWLDGTRTGDHSLKDLPIPDDDWALPLRTGAVKLERLNPREPTEPYFDETLRMDLTAGLDKPAPTHVERIFREDRALAEKEGFSALDKADLDRRLREIWRQAYSWIKADKVAWSFDEAKGVGLLTLDGTALPEWTRNHRFRDLDLEQTSLGWRANFEREPGVSQDAPYAVAYPSYRRWTVIIRLPDGGAGFSLAGGQDEDRTVAGIVFKRASKIEGGVLTSVTSDRAVAREFPASDAPAAAIALRDLYAFNVTLRAAPVVMVASSDDSAAGAGPAASAPTDAAGFNARGVVALRQDKPQAALADFDRAIAMAPQVASYRYNHGAAELAMQQPDRAVVDFSAVIEAQPADVLAHIARAGAYLQLRKDDLAAKDFEAALGSGPPSARNQLMRADAYKRARRFGEAVKLYDDWLARFPADPQRLVALFRRCEATLGWGQHLETGVAACDQALTLKADDVDLLRTRGLLQLARGQSDAAEADLGKAVKLDPDRASVQFAWAMLQKRLGRAADADRAFATARRLSSTVDADFAELGLKP